LTALRAVMIWHKAVIIIACVHMGTERELVRIVHAINALSLLLGSGKCG